MHIIEATDEWKDKWEKFLAENAVDGGLLQSWAWGDVQKALDNRILRLVVLNDAGDLWGVCLMIRHDLQFDNSYWYCPRGPVLHSKAEECLPVLAEKMYQVAREEKSFMIRLDPPWMIGNEKYLEACGFRKSENEVQPKCNLIVDVARTPDEILASMKQKTRYNIGLAIKRGVNVRLSKEPSDLESFWQLIKQTAERDGFRPHNKDHYKKLFETLANKDMCQLFLAEYEGKVVAANIVSFYNNYATYLHGASSDIYRDVMATYLLQWEGMLYAQKAGCSFYDLGGMNGETYNNPKWEGISRFKASFAPQLKCKEYIGSFERVVNPVAFSVYKFVKQLRG